MTSRFRTQIIFSILAAVAVVGIFLLLQATTTWEWYYCWPIAASLVAFVFYGLDKSLAKVNTRRIPEVVLHLLALMGGFAGALLGMLVFRHKTNFRAHPLFLPIIVVSAALWGYVIYQLTR